MVGREWKRLLTRSDRRPLTINGVLIRHCDVQGLNPDFPACRNHFGYAFVLARTVTTDDNAELFVLRFCIGQFRFQFRHADRVVVEGHLPVVEDVDHAMPWRRGECSGVRNLRHTDRDVAFVRSGFVGEVAADHEEDD